MELSIEKFNKDTTVNTDINYNLESYILNEAEYFYSEHIEGNIKTTYKSIGLPGFIKKYSPYITKDDSGNYPTNITDDNGTFNIIECDHETLENIIRNIQESVKSDEVYTSVLSEYKSEIPQTLRNIREMKMEMGVSVSGESFDIYLTFNSNASDLTYQIIERDDNTSQTIIYTNTHDDYLAFMKKYYKYVVDKNGNMKDEAELVNDFWQTFVDIDGAENSVWSCADEINLKTIIECINYFRWNKAKTEVRAEARVEHKQKYLKYKQKYLKYKKLNFN